MKILKIAGLSIVILFLIVLILEQTMKDPIYIR